MSDWRAQIGFNFNTSFPHTCGMRYPPGSEQNPGNVNVNHGNLNHVNLDNANLNSWAEAGVPDIPGNLNTGMPQAYFGANREDYMEHIPEPHAASGHVNYQGSAVFIGNADVFDNGGQNNLMLLSGTHTPSAYNTPTNENRGTGSETASDTESHTESHTSHTSPDSWSSGSSNREGSLPQMDPIAWAKEELTNDTDSLGRASTNEDVSSSPEAPAEPQNIPVPKDETAEDILDLPAAAPPPPKKQIAKGTRTSFKDGQMSVLVQRFTVQRYLTPAEMKAMAEVTGLTYKQVKTWFQNRRMKLRRHERDNNWVADRCFNKGKQSLGIFANMPPHLPPYQAETHNYSQGMVDMAAFKNPTPQNLAYYLSAAGSGGFPSSGFSSGGFPSGGFSSSGFSSGSFPSGGFRSGGFPSGGFPSGGLPTGGFPSGGLPTGGLPPAPGSGSFPSWPPPAPQAAGPSMLQNGPWSMPPPINHFDFMPSTFANAPAGNNAGPDGNSTS